MPPLLEHLDSLLTGSGQDLRLRTFKLVDQLVGTDARRARRHHAAGCTHRCPPAQSPGGDATVLLRQRAAYPAGIPDGESRTDPDWGRVVWPCRRRRRPRSHSADGRRLRAARVPAARIDLGHVGVFRALAAAAGLDAELEGTLLLLLQAKDVPSLRELCVRVDEPVRSALLGLSSLYGGVEILAAAARAHCPPCRKLPPPWRPCSSYRRRCPICRCLSIWRTCAATTITTASSLPPIVRRSRVPSHAAGVMTASARLLAARGQRPAFRWICANWHGWRQAARSRGRFWRRTGQPTMHWRRAIAALRAQGEIVVELLPGEQSSEGPRCDRQLVERDGQWLIEAINRNGSP
jgi:ATP phosphoribosyltransferase regulatory subunit